jgi:hypothetical protein
MNKANRKKLNEIASNIELIKIELEECRELEDEKFNNLPEGLQQSEKGQSISNAVYSMFDAIYDLDSACNNIDFALNS